MVATTSQEDFKLPSLLIFGPQTEFPSDDVLTTLRQELIQNLDLAPLRETVKDTIKFWETLTAFDPSLQNVSSSASLTDLHRWLDCGGEFPHRSSTSSNIFTFPATFLLQITLYTRYLTWLGGSEPHETVLEAVKTGGIQGFCVGLLSAVTVSAARNIADIGAVASVSFRLAICIGAYVDLHTHSAETKSPSSCISARWNPEHASGRLEIEHLIGTFPDAYISSITDDTCVTITARTVDVAHLTEKLQAHKVRVKDIPVQGCFHSVSHQIAVTRVLEFASQFDSLSFPSADKLKVTVRSPADGGTVISGSLIRVVLDNTLLKVADWYTTVRSALLQIPRGHKTVLVAGSGNVIPPSLIQDLNLNVLSLNTIDRTQSRSSSEPHFPPHAIAIVGMAGRFPGADSLDELWDLLAEGKVTVERAPLERLSLPSTGDYVNKHWWGNFLKTPDAFDHRFFKKSSREALAWDPQQRILLEVVYQALESSGYFRPTSDSQPEDYGCYIGAATSNYYDNVSCHPSSAYATVGTSRSFFSGAMSHHFGWTGPALTIDTACSSSLVAIHTACRAIWSGECSRAIAGGTNIITSPFDYQNLEAARFLSSTGQCKPFDVDADGYCRGEGVAAVVLKPLADALEEKDDIMGVIMGSAVNQNHNCSHVTVPHAESQSKLYHQVMKISGIKAHDVSYVEAHGTGTGVGDPVECHSIRDAFAGPSRDEKLYFSSIKGNIGHTEATAGIAGLLKVLLMMRHGQIPPQASHKLLNPSIPALAPDRMEIPRALSSWNAPSRIACVNSYGAAGSNAAVIVAQKSQSAGRRKSIEVLSKYPLFISAASAQSLSDYGQRLIDWLSNSRSRSAENILASDLAFNLADKANHTLSHIFTSAVTDLRDLQQKLSAIAAGALTAIKPDPQPVVLVFGGQESEWVGISESVYRTSSLLRFHLDECDRILVSIGFESLYPAIFQQTEVANLVTLHSTLFAVQYASAKAWMDCGLVVSAVLGHSFGQLTALCISGVLSLQDALRLVTGRAEIMLKHWCGAKGSMIFLQADRERVSEILRKIKAQGMAYDAEIACYNGSESHVIVGSAETIDDLENFVRTGLQSPILTKRLKVRYGYHSVFTEQMLPHLTALAESLVWNSPTIRIEPCSEVQTVADPDHTMIAEHTRQPVFFQQAVERLVNRFPRSTWLEVGRGSSVIQLVKLSVPKSDGNKFLSPRLTSANAQGSLIDTTLDLWKAGHAVQYWSFHRSQRSEYQAFSLPPYQFEKTKFWLSFKRQRSEQEQASKSAQGVSPRSELLSFLGFDDANKLEASFRISSSSERFKTMLKGHVISGQSLAPASLYFEVVARAALSLQSDSVAADWIPTIKDLVMMFPISLDNTKDIILKLRRKDVSDLSWLFSITIVVSSNSTSRASAPLEQSSGTVHLLKRNDSHAARSFQRFESLTGYRRCQDIMSHPDAEKMSGKHVYRAFSQIVDYGEEFRGIKELACMNLEAVGRVTIAPSFDGPPDQRFCDTPMIDSLMQTAGFLVNYFNNPSREDLFICHEIERIQLGGTFNPDAKEWIIYSIMSDCEDGQPTADAYIFEAESKKMVMAVFGFCFTKTSQSQLARHLNQANKSTSPIAVERAMVSYQVAKKSLATSSDSAAMTTKTSASKRLDLLQILHNVTDIPTEDLSDESTLDDLGVDSLGATEVLNDVRVKLGLTIDLSSFLFFPNIGAIVAHINEQLGFVNLDADVSAYGSTSDSKDCESSSSNLSGSSFTSLSIDKEDPLVAISQEDASEAQARPCTISSHASFEKIKFRYDRLAAGTKAADFWSDVYPDQARLVRAYVLEAFFNLGCDLQRLQPGERLPDLRLLCLPRHNRLLHQLHLALEDGGLIKSTETSFVRTKVSVDTTSAETMYAQMIGQHPQHDIVNELVRAVGSRLADCLKGEVDGLQIVFGDRYNKRLLETIYRDWPLLRPPTLLLGDFLKEACSSSAGTVRIRILEIGSGTGGTTQYIVNHLRNNKIAFEYVFTDISPSLVAAAKRKFNDVEGMSFEVLDVENPPAEYRGAFHFIISTNCIHATRSLEVSLTRCREMLREDGTLTLIEITKNMFWLDIVFGLFEGWWLFEDGRSHAVVDEKHWESAMRKAGFEEVSWTQGNLPESNTIRVIAAFPSASTIIKKNVMATVQTVVYKKLGDLEILADVYCPVSANTSSGKLPIALMIHGGSHILFSRKDIRPPQTRLLLERGYLPVSLDHRLCPEVTLREGPMVDVRDALKWARTELPLIARDRFGLNVDGERVVAIGWSSGGQLAMSLAWTSLQVGLRPPEAILAFYCPTDYEDKWWQAPIQPVGAEDRGEEYDVLEAVQDHSITNYGVVGAWAPLSDSRIRTDPRCRIVLHINWKAQTLPVIIGGLPSRDAAGSEEAKDWNALPQPSVGEIIPVSPRAQIIEGNYRTPTFMVHGTRDDLIPWEQSRDTYLALRDHGVETGLALVEGAPHICDLSTDPQSNGWKAVLEGYDFIDLYAL